ncbi:SDR family oxidoreductase [Rhodopirellula sallentina]|uniref:NmrA family protein n=1 Tax=Rhodopirellula sallentina SM41 TaxID=1263870 RepID=M5TT73_9BACT|nr:SDR family oxidoreductase [Rhodopirellula sallentina]EMI52244.1 NmrA family protein [Rhodopirellula sallentina SM41]
MSPDRENQSRPKVLVVGATGYLGKHMIQCLHRRGYWVRVLVRDESRLADVKDLVDEVFVGEATKPESLIGVCDGIEIVFSSLGITRQKDGLTYQDVDYGANKNVLDLAIRSGVEKFLYVSALNADKLPDVKILAAKEHFVSELRESSIDSIVVRPNGFFSDMKEFLSMARGGRVYLFGDGEYRSNPIDGTDLANFCIDQFSFRNTCVDIGGPDVLTANEIADLAFAATGQKRRVTYIPLWITKALLFGMRKFTGVETHGPIEFFLTVLTMDMVAPSTGTRRLADFFQDEAKTEQSQR